VEESLTQGLSIGARTILLVEHEMNLANEIKTALEQIGYLVRTAPIADAICFVRTKGAALLILDRLAFEVDSLRAVEALREQGFKIPILMISVLSTVEQRAEGLRAGADDYIVKPFYMVELVARVEALLRRLGNVHTTTLRVGDLRMDLIEQVAFRGAVALNLLPREFKLLEYFCRRPGQVITREMLLEDVWGFNLESESNVVDAHISNLRKKIDDQGLPSRIANVRGMGYILRH
jgi:two-component system OmpR family response regulator